MLNQTPTKFHQHEFVEIAIIVEGSAIQVYGDMEFEVTKGDVFVIRPDHPHTLKKTRKLNICNILFMDDGSIPLLDGLIETPGFRALFQLEPAMRKNDDPQRRLKLNSTQFDEVITLASRMKTALLTKTSSNPTVATIHLLELITTLCTAYADMPTQESKTLTQLSLAVSHIEANFKEEIRVDDLARKASMSVRTFQRHFQQTFGVPCSKYLLKHRLSEARRLLEVSDASVADIGFQSGFEDTTYFSRAFRKETGTSPLKYRDSLG